MFREQQMLLLASVRVRRGNDSLFRGTLGPTFPFAFTKRNMNLSR